MLKKIIWVVIILVIASTVFAGLFEDGPDYFDAHTTGEKAVALLGFLYGLTGAATLVALLWKRRFAFYIACIWAAIVFACGLLAIFVFTGNEGLWVALAGGFVVLLLILVPILVWLRRNT